MRFVPREYVHHLEATSIYIPVPSALEESPLKNLNKPIKNTDPRLRGEDEVVTCVMATWLRKKQAKRLWEVVNVRVLGGFKMTNFANSSVQRSFNCMSKNILWRAIERQHDFKLQLTCSLYQRRRQLIAGPRTIFSCHVVQTKIYRGTLEFH